MKAKRLALYVGGWTISFLGSVITAAGLYCAMRPTASDLVDARTVMLLAQLLIPTGGGLLFLGVILERIYSTRLRRPGWTVFSAGIGARVIGLASLAAAIAIVASVFRNDGSNYSDAPLILAGLLVVGILGILAGRELTHGKRDWAILIRRLIGVALLLAAAIVWIMGLHDSDVPLWLAIVLAAGGIGVFLSWKQPGSVASRP